MFIRIDRPIAFGFIGKQRGEQGDCKHDRRDEEDKHGVIQDGVRASAFGNLAGKEGNGQGKSSRQHKQGGKKLLAEGDDLKETPSAAGHALADCRKQIVRFCAVNIGKIHVKQF